MLLNDVPRDLRIHAFALNKKGQISEPFFAGNKWTLLQLVDKEVGVERPYSYVKGQMEAELRRNKAMKELKQIIEERRQQIKVEINKTALMKFSHPRSGT